MPVKHSPHLCYHCSCTILKDEEEIRVPGMRRSYEIRYQHATEEGCRKALNRHQPAVYGRDPEDDAERMYNGTGYRDPLPPELSPYKR